MVVIYISVLLLTALFMLYSLVFWASSCVFSSFTFLNLEAFYSIADKQQRYTTSADFTAGSLDNERSENDGWTGWSWFEAMDTHSTILLTVVGRKASQNEKHTMTMTAYNTSVRTGASSSVSSQLNTKKLISGWQLVEWPLQSLGLNVVEKGGWHKHGLNK